MMKQQICNSDEQPFLLMWEHLNLDEMQERIDWLRENLTARSKIFISTNGKSWIRPNMKFSSLTNLKS